jgi:hypothetical protein
LKFERNLFLNVNFSIAEVAFHFDKNKIKHIKDVPFLRIFLQHQLPKIYHFTYTQFEKNHQKPSPWIKVGSFQLNQ